MSTTAPHPVRPAPALPSRPVHCLDEVAAWIHEVTPVVAALPAHRRPSVGQRRWLAEQHELAAEALELLACACFEAEGDDEPCAELEWLHTRTAALLAATATRTATTARTPAAA